MTPAQVGLLYSEHRSETGADRAPTSGSTTPHPAREEQGTVSDLAYWASLPLRG
jgi:hypothetical protein